MFKSNGGVVLIEMLMSLVVISFIMLLLLNLMLIVTETISYEQINTKAIQVTSLVYDDILNARKITSSDQCLLIAVNQDAISYCIVEDSLIRKVNNQGYERLLTNSGLKFINDGYLQLQLTIGDNEIGIPIWGLDE